MEPPLMSKIVKKLNDYQVLNSLSINKFLGVW